MSSAEALTLEDDWVPADTLGARLAIVRNTMHWNVAQAARECDLPVQSWRQWESGTKPHDPVDVAKKIHARTGASISWLVLGGDLRRTCFSVDPYLGQLELAFLEPPALALVGTD